MQAAVRQVGLDFAGEIDEIIVYDPALSDAEVAALDETFVGLMGRSTQL